jgi:uncharacterized phiE125 gp8 family phage protein
MPSILLSGPTVEPVTLTEAKLYLRVEHDDDDDLIAALVAGSRIHVESQTRRALITQTWRLVRDAWPASGRLFVLPVPLISLVAARVYTSDTATQAIDLAAFAVDKAPAPALLAFRPGTLPAPGRAVAGIEIDITTGYGAAPGDVPQALRQAIRLLTAHWYENRGLAAVGQQVALLPTTVAALIAPYQVLSL